MCDGRLGVSHLDAVEVTLMPKRAAWKCVNSGVQQEVAVNQPDKDALLTMSISLSVICSVLLLFASC